MPLLPPEAPARGTRPRNRRALTVEAATELFYRRGYPQVGMSDIARATNVGASALYRHFPSKADLLVAVIHSGIAPFGEVLSRVALAEGDAAARLRTGIRELVEVAIDNRRIGVLWQRDGRNLSDDEQRELREFLGSATGDLATAVLAARPELDAREADVLAWCVMGALVSIAFHALELPRPEFVDLLVDIATGITSTPMVSAPLDIGDVPAPASDDSRRDAIISVATQLFADRGFAATGIDDIGEAAGIAGPSVYSHFESKQAILAAAIGRADAILERDLDAALQRQAGPTETLALLIGSYVRRANSDRYVIRTLISEMDQLSSEDRDEARREQRRYIDAWVDLYRRFTEVDAVSARIRVQAVLLVVNDAVQTPHLRERAGFEQVLTRLGEHLLGITA